MKSRFAKYILRYSPINGRSSYKPEVISRNPISVLSTAIWSWNRNQGMYGYYASQMMLVNSAEVSFHAAVSTGFTWNRPTEGACARFSGHSICKEV